MKALDTARGPEKSFLDSAIPTALRIGGAVGGGIAGTLAAPGPGTLAGGAAGSALGELLAQKYEGRPLNLTQIGVQGALGALPVGRAAGTLGRIALKRAGVGAAQGAVGAAATESAETGKLPSLGTIGTGALYGTVLGGTLGAAEGRALRRLGKLTPVEATPPVTPPVAPPVARQTTRPVATPPIVDSPVVTPPVRRGTGSRLGRTEAWRKQDVERANRVIDNTNLTPDEKATTRELFREKDYFQSKLGPVPLARIQTIADDIIAEGKVQPKPLSIAAPVEAQARMAYGAVEDTRRAVEKKLAANPGIKSVAQLSDTDKADLLSTSNAMFVKYAVARENISEVARTMRNHQKMLSVMRDPDGRFLQDAVKAGATRLDALDKMMTLPKALDRYRFIRDLAKPTKQDWWKWYYLSSLLSSPRTQLVNAISTATKTGLDVTAPFFQANPVAGAKEGMASVAGAMHGIREGWGKMAFMFQNGYSVEHAIRNVDLPVEISIRGSRTLPNVIGRAMQTSDEFFRNIAAESAAYRWAYTTAKKAGHPYGSKAFNNAVADTLSNRPVALIAEMEEAGRLGTFRQKGGKGLRVIKRGRAVLDEYGAAFGDEVERLAGSVLSPRLSRVLGTVASVPIGSFIAPFVQTPANLIRAGLAYSPVGALRGIVTGDKRLLQQGISGTIATMGLALIANDDKLTGAAPSDPKERDQWYAEGKLPNSIKIGGSWFSYEATPFVLQLGVIASAYEAHRRLRAEGGKMDAIASTQMVGEVMGRLGKSLLQPGYLSGVMSLQKAVMEPERHGGSWAGRAASSLVPASSLLRATTRVVDPTIREAKTLPEYLQKGIPGLSSRLPPQLDYEGEDITKPGGWINRSLNPMTRSKETKDPLRLALRESGGRLSRPVGQLGRLSLTREEQKNVERRVGRTQAAILRRLVALPGFAALPKAAQLDALAKVGAQARKAARDSIDKQPIVDRLIEELKQENQRDPDPARSKSRMDEFLASLPKTR